jgi:hypothetical protein
MPMEVNSLPKAEWGIARHDNHQISLGATCLLEVIPSRIVETSLPSCHDERKVKRGMARRVLCACPTTLAFSPVELALPCSHS